MIIYKEKKRVTVDEKIYKLLSDIPRLRKNRLDVLLNTFHIEINLAFSGYRIIFPDLDKNNYIQVKK